MKKIGKHRVPFDGKEWKEEESLRAGSKTGEKHESLSLHLPLVVEERQKTTLKHFGSEMTVADKTDQFKFSIVLLKEPVTE